MDPSGHNVAEAVDRLAEMAGRSEPDPMSDEEARRLAELAVDRATNDGRSRGRQRALALSAAAAAVVALVTSLALNLGDAPAPAAVRGDEPLRLELPTGDRVVAAGGADFRIISAVSSRRHIDLASGTMLFDVARGAVPTSFLVETPHMTVKVRGTVFSVEAGREHSTVRVFEGSVEVLEEERRMVVEAGQSMTSSRGLRPLSGDGLLSDEAHRLAGERTGNSAARALEPAGPEQDPSIELQSPSEPVTSTVAEGDPPDRGDGEAEAPDRNRRPRQRRVDPPTLAEGRRLIRRGRAEEALRVARGAVTTGQPEGPWRMLEADALRALRRFGQAAHTYDSAGEMLPRSQAAQCGYLAASLRFGHLSDPAGALQSLERFGSASRGSPLQERAAALRVRILLSMGRLDEAQRHARAYLADYPEGGTSSWMEGLLP